MLDYIISHYIYIYIYQIISHYMLPCHIQFTISFYIILLYSYTMIYNIILDHYIYIYIYIGGEIPCVCFSRVHHKPLWAACPVPALQHVEVQHHVFAWPIDTWDLEPGSRDNVGITTIHWNDSFYWNYDSYIEQSNDNVGIPTLRRKWCEEPKEVSS